MGHVTDIPQLDRTDPEGAIAAAVQRCSNWGRWGTDDVLGTLNHLDEAKRRELLHQAQEIEYNEGGLIIWGFRQQVDGFAQGVQGLEPSKYLPLGNYKFSKVSV